MTFAAFVFALLAGNGPDPQLRLGRMAFVTPLHLRDARLFVAKKDGRAVELTGNARDAFLALLDTPETYSDTPGVIGCIAKQYVVTVVFHDRVRESWFCVGCQRIMPTWPAGESSDGFDAVLSKRGAEKIERVFESAVHRKKKRPADAGRCD